MSNLNEFDSSFSNLNDNKLIELLFYGNDKFNDKRNHCIIMSTIKFVRGSQRFAEQLL